ncbi:uncharacterized protein HMPREF1541_06604 [Cyphellophora europaea CBS 101466]|uniref:Uncharacterized protein n=1 Tax=Cyphellophora europaea (strain CBS 101466) TaxID=1220924 RepID=W2RQ18_CYPE1|nr:uncharacterized protein HMPREF1541_06604 [Cyphellophora europaea CBS 101466]ETN38567.1 hypothetical protein HMPREF1541_06604 [Cyphellophora europaea CBS 101466]
MRTVRGPDNNSPRDAIVSHRKMSTPQATTPLRLPLACLHRPQDRNTIRASHSSMASHIRSRE